MKITLTELMQILATDAEVKALRAERIVLKQQIMDLVAGDEEMQAKVQAAFEKSEVVEAKMRAVVESRPVVNP